VRLLAVDAEGLALEAGSARAVNIALLGAASTVLSFSDEAWRAGLAAAVPARILAVNERAFALGRDAAHQEVAP
jgi:indolepyruvate ferredoxin oxidoreductase beta subunit